MCIYVGVYIVISKYELQIAYQVIYIYMCMHYHFLTKCEQPVIDMSPAYDNT